MAMKLVNKLKENNSKVLLADGTDLGLAETDRYQDLQGVIGGSLKAIASMRKSAIETNEAMGLDDEPLICDDEEFKQVLLNNSQSSRLKVENRDGVSRMKVENRDGVSRMKVENRDVGVSDDGELWGYNKKIKDEKKSVKATERMKSEPFQPKAQGVDVIDLLDSDDEGEKKHDSEQDLRQALDEATKQGNWETVSKIAGELAQIK